MSPIGRVFIVLNLVLAGAFVGFAGTHLQKQHNYKTLYEQEKDAHQKEADALKQEVARGVSERQAFEIAKTQRETEIGGLKNVLQAANDKNTRLEQQLSSVEGDLKQVNAQLVQANQQSSAAFTQSKEAYQMAIADQKAKDEAVRAKDDAEAENRSLKNTIASLTDTVKGKDVAIADLTKDLNENKLLVSVASTNGFIPALAAPPLSGTVSHASGRLCTISITDNPSNVDIADQINKRQFSFAIYDASGYKGEAVATSYHPAENAVTCNLMLVKGDIKEGDKASTKTP